MIDQFLEVAHVIEPPFESLMGKDEPGPERVVFPHLTVRKLVDVEPFENALPALGDRPRELVGDEDVAGPFWTVSPTVFVEMDSSKLLRI